MTAAGHCSTSLSGGTPSFSTTQPCSVQMARLGWLLVAVLLGSALPTSVPRLPKQRRLGPSRRRLSLPRRARSSLHNSLRHFYVSAIHGEIPAPLKLNVSVSKKIGQPDFGSDRPEDLAISEASQLIDDLKAQTDGVGARR